MAQEPGLLHGHAGVRFDEGSGLYHYITSCTADKPYADGDAATALCWLVIAAHVQRVDGKIVQSPQVNGVVKISADDVRFVPEQETTSIPLTTFARSTVSFGHKAGTTEARFGNNDGVYLFAFTDTCFHCTRPATPSDAPAVAQSDAEFELFHQALTDFASVNERLRDLSSQMRVRIAPGDQPTEVATAATMGLYSDLNKRLAEFAPEPAKSCVLQHASYQACKAGVAPTTCSGLPQCTASIVLPKDFDQKGLTITMPKEGDAAEVRPAGVSVADLGPVKIAGGIVAGQLLERVNPVYPPMAKSRRMSGTVKVRAIITKQGTVASLTVDSSTDAIFNDAALDAVKKWRYKPFLLNGAPCEVDTVVTVNFAISGGPARPSLGSQDDERLVPIPRPGTPPDGL